MASEPGTENWRDAIDPALPYWSEHLDLIERLRGRGFPDCAALNRLLPAGLGHAGQPEIRFVSSKDHDPGPYEQRIFEQGQVSTRPDNWHDLFNALSWALLPRIKLAMNALHCRDSTKDKENGRGPLRDALTLFDECGVIVACTDRDWLERLARHEWDKCLYAHAGFFSEQVTLVVAGHALLEKFLSPYPSITGNALLLHIDTETQALPRQERLARLDERLSAAMTRGGLLRVTRDLSPLPVMGIPGWSPGERQDRAFYANRSIFRPQREGRQPAPVHSLA